MRAVARRTLTSRTFGDGATTACEYDPAGRVASATRSGGTTTFDWTSQGELAQVTTPSATVGYEYDLAGNIVARAEGGDVG